MQVHSLVARLVRDTDEDADSSEDLGALLALAHHYDTALLGRAIELLTVSCL